MKRSLRDGALIAEIVGAVAVVISLVYVGASVNQNTRALMVANHHALVAMDLEKNAWLRDPQFAEIFETANDEASEQVDAVGDISRLSAAQARQYRTFEADTFNAWEFAFITHNDGMMDDNIWEGWDSYYRGRMQKKGPQWFWMTSREGFSPAFRTYVDSTIR